jgi:hypothetical protein
LIEPQYRSALRLSRWATIGLLIGLFLLAFFLRAYQPSSRSTHWLDRAEALNAALDARDWATTYQAPHPGYTTMVIAGLTLRLYDALDNIPGEALFDWAIPPYATGYGRRAAVGTLGLAVVLAGLIVAITLVLRRLAGWPLALSAAGLMTFEPVYLSQSRVLHVDALLSTLMLLSGLLLLLSLETGRRGYLLLSGLVGGLALLTKMPGLFLVPFTGLALLVYLTVRLRAAWPDHSQQRGRWLAGEVWRGLVWPGLLWGLMAALPFALWPAMWVKPLSVLKSMATAKEIRLSRTHPNPRFFAGRVYVDERPSIFLYPVTLAFNSTFLTLTLSLVALGHYTLWRRRGRPPLRPVSFWLLVAYAFFFTLQMAIGAKQDERYVLPVHLALDVLAAVGLVGLVELVRQAASSRHVRLARASGALIGLAVGLQMLVALLYAPNYGAHHNHLLGGNRVAVKMIEIMAQNEGVDYVADYLGRQPDVASLRLGISPTLGDSVAQHFRGKIIVGMPPDADYYLFNVAAIQRRFNPEQWEATWEAYRDQPAQVVVIFDGAECMWLYAAQPDESVPGVVIRRGGIGLVGLAWAWTAALLAVLVWALRQPMSVDRVCRAESSMLH